MNINGTKIHSALHIPCRPTFLPLNNEYKAELRNRYSEVELVRIDKILIDKISMVSSKLLYQIHKRLREIFTPTQDIAVDGILVLVCGYFYQKSTVRAKSVFMFRETGTAERFISRDLWWTFKFAELDQVIRQNDNRMFVELRNRIGIDEIDESAENVLKSCFILFHYPIDASYVFDENTPT